jgi:ribonuclease G
LAEWLVEEGIGEHRAIRLQGGEIIAARLHWPGSLTAGQVEDATLVKRRAGTPRGTVQFANGERALVDKLPRSASEGAAIRVEVTRARARELGRAKCAQAKPTDKPLRPAPGLAETLREEGHDARIVRRFPSDADWGELWTEATLKRVDFTGGSLLLYPTPAMVLIDIDGADDPVTLAKAAVTPLARSLRRLDLAGNIGVDFPTLASKADRKAVDAALDAALVGWPHERTAMNGFGFVQLVSRLERDSLVDVLCDVPGAQARRLLRQAEQVEEPGVLVLHCVDWVAKAIRDEWLAELVRRTGRQVRLEIDKRRVSPEANFVQAIPQ